MIIFGKEIISVAIQRGMFTPENTLLTASVLAAYSYGLFSVGAFNFLQRFFYSCNDFRTPFRIAVLVCVLDIALSVLLKDTALSVSGLALANTISFTAGLALMIWSTKKRLLRIGLRGVLLTWCKTIGSLLLPSAALLVFLRVTGQWWERGSSLRTLGLLLLGTVIFCTLTFAGFRLTRIEVLSVLIRRNKRTLSTGEEKKYE
jgi:putative peptidoglycan lipid II flippase